MPPTDAHSKKKDQLLGKRVERRGDEDSTHGHNSSSRSGLVHSESASDSEGCQNENAQKNAENRESNLKRKSMEVFMCPHTT